MTDLITENKMLWLTLDKLIEELEMEGLHDKQYYKTTKALLKSIESGKYIDGLDCLIQEYNSKLNTEQFEKVGVYETYTGTGEFCAPYNRFKYIDGLIPSLGMEVYIRIERI